MFQGLFLVFDFGYERLNEADEYYSTGPLRAKAEILVVTNILVFPGMILVYISCPGVITNSVP